MDTQFRENIGAEIERIALMQPHAPALLTLDREPLTYSALSAQIRYVGSQLRHWRIYPGEVVAALIIDRPAMALACPAFCASSTLSPLNPTLTKDAYRRLLRRLNPKAVVLQCDISHPIRAIVRELGVMEIALLVDESGPAGSFALHRAHGAEKTSDLSSRDRSWAFILSTSGSTGMSKLVPASHRRMIHNAREIRKRLEYEVGDIGCHLSPMHLGQGLYTSLLTPLLGGSAVVVLEENDIHGFFRALGDYRITVLTTGFTLAQAIADHAASHQSIIARHGLRFLRCGSGTLSADQIDRIESALRVPVLTAYSTTETGAITIEPLRPGTRKRGGVGHPVACEVAVVANSGNRCAAGEIGEVMVRGPAVFDGYVDDPRLSAQSFVDDWYRTGDVGLVDNDGYLFIKGRSKDVINRGGVKLLPEEIDKAMERVPGVLEAAAFAVPHPTLGEELVAAVVSRDQGETWAAPIIEGVRARLGPTRVPRRIYFVDSLPRTQSGKIRRSELPRLLGLDRLNVAVTDESAVGVHAPRSPMEAALSGLWCTVLLRSNIGANDDFFLLGGDSLQGARLLTSINAVFGVELTIENLFKDCSTIAGMAHAIEATRSGNSNVNRE